MKYTKKLLMMMSLLGLFGGAYAFGPIPPTAETVTSYMHVINLMSSGPLVSENQISVSPGMIGPGNRYIYNEENKQLEVKTPKNSSASYVSTFALSTQGPSAPGACVLEYDVTGSNQQTAFNLIKQSDGSQGFTCLVQTNHVYMIPKSS